MPADERVGSAFDRWGTTPRRGRTDYIEIYQARDRSWRWRHKAGNHKVLASGEGYTRRRDAVRGAKRAAPGAVLKD